MKVNGTYSPDRLQKAIGNMAGTHLGFKSSLDGGIKTFPDATTQIVEIKRVYPSRKIVEFSFIDSKEIYTAYALLDYWHREGKDKNITPENPISYEKEVNWPFTAPETTSPDLITILQLLVLMGVSGAPPMLTIIQKLTSKLQGKREVLGLIQNQKITLQTLLKALEINTQELENITDIKLLENPQKEEPTDIKTTKNKNNSDNEQSNYIEPKEPLYGAITPIKGEKNRGYLFIWFIKL